MRKLSESIWGNIRKKSLGQEIRLQDDINSLSLEGLCSYLNENYTCRDDNCIFCQTMDDTLVLTVALYYSLGAPGYLYYTGEEIAIYKSSIDTLRCRGKLTYSYATSSDMDSTTISPKDKSIPVNNKFFIEVLDFFIDIVSKSGFEQKIKKKLSESVWGDVRKKSLGITTRHEDEYNQDEQQTIKNKRLVPDFVVDVVYRELYENTLDGFLKFMDEKMSRYKSNTNSIYQDWYKELIPIFGKIRQNWDAGYNFCSLIQAGIDKENDRIKKLGFTKMPGETIEKTVDDWWKNEAEQQYVLFTVAKFDEDDPENRRTDYDELWNSISIDEKFEIYMKCMSE